MVKVVVLAVVLLTLGHGVADAKCARKGKVLFRAVSRPLKDTTVGRDAAPSSTLTIYATGAWQRDQARGCLGKRHLAALRSALAAAKFQIDTTGQGTCKAIPTAEIVYTSPKRKKRVTTMAPCGPVLDEDTTNLVVCAELAGSSEPIEDVSRMCRGIDPGE